MTFPIEYMWGYNVCVQYPFNLSDKDLLVCVCTRVCEST